MSATQTQTVPKSVQVTAPIPELKLDEDKLTALAAGKVISYTPLGEQTPIRLSLGMIQQYCAVATRKGFLPEIAECIRFGMLVMTRRLNPFTGDCYFVGYDSQDGPNFSMIVGVQALFKRAEIHPQYDGIESGIVVQNGTTKQIEERQGDMVFPGETVIGGWAKVYRKDRSRPSYQRLNLSTFKKDTKFWKADPAGLICKTAESHSLRQAFPTDVGGLYLEAEIEAFADHAAHSASTRKFEFEPKAGPVDLDTLSKHAPEAQNRTSRAEPAQTAGPAGGETVQSGSSGQETEPGTPGKASGGQETVQDDQNQTADEPSGQVQNGQTTPETPPEPEFDDRDSKIETWKGDIDTAGTNGRLDQIADLAKQHAPPAIRGQVMELISTKRSKLKGNGK